MSLTAIPLEAEERRELQAFRLTGPVRRGSVREAARRFRLQNLAARGLVVAEGHGALAVWRLSQFGWRRASETS